MHAFYLPFIYNSILKAVELLPVLIMQTPENLFTGPDAYKVCDTKNGGEPHEKWKAFVLPEQKNQGLVLDKGSEVLYQVCKYHTSKIMMVNLQDSKYLN